MFFAKGQRILLEGNPENSIYFLKSGKVKIYRTGAQGSEHLLHFASSGNLVGFAMDNETGHYNVSAMAVTDVVVCQLPGIAFRILIRKFPELAHSLLQMYAEALKKAEDRLVKLAFLPVKARVIDALLMILKAEDEREKIPLDLSRQDIANLAATTKEQVSKILSGLRAQRLILTKGKRIELLNTHALRKMIPGD